MIKIVTISREFGSGGRTIGKEVAEKLGIPCYDKDFIEKIAEETGYAKEFIADESEFKEMLKTAPKKNVGIFEGVYNEETDEITANRYLDADRLDAKTKEVLEREPLVVLS